MERCRRRAPYFLSWNAAIFYRICADIPKFHINNLHGTFIQIPIAKDVVIFAFILVLVLFVFCLVLVLFTVIHVFQMKEKSHDYLFNYRIKTSASSFADKTFDPVLSASEGRLTGTPVLSFAVQRLSMLGCVIIISTRYGRQQTASAPSCAW